MNLDEIFGPFRQIIPGRACAVAEEHRIDEKTVASRGAAEVTHAPGQTIRDRIPWIVAQSMATPPPASDWPTDHPSETT
jgi:hypothetical protein